MVSCNDVVLMWCVVSYKLWYNYLKLVRRQVRGRCVTDPAYEDANSAFERALVFMHKVHWNFISVIAGRDVNG